MRDAPGSDLSFLLVSLFLGDSIVISIKDVDIVQLKVGLRRVSEERKDVLVAA